MGYSMKTIEERAEELAKELCITSHDYDCHSSYEYDIACIIVALEEQERITCESIIEKLHSRTYSIKLANGNLADVITIDDIERIILKENKGEY